MVRALLLALMLLAPLERARAHPLHTSLTQITLDASRRNASISIRGFAEDLSASAKASGVSVAAYAAQSFRLTDGRGRAMRLTPCGVRRVGDLVWLCFKARIDSSANGLRVLSTMMFDRYDDQINVVSAILPEGRRNFLFTSGDAPRKLAASG